MNEKSGSNIQLLLRDQLSGCSKQRLRALQVSLRRYGNDDLRISAKDLQLAKQENDIYITDRAMAEIYMLYQDSLGINYQGIYDCLMETHATSGRDSVLAMSHKKKGPTIPSEKKISDIIERLQKSVMNVEPSEVSNIEKFFSENDQCNSQLLPENLVLSHINKLDLPIYGSLLKSLVSYFCEEKDLTFVRWRPLLDVLDIILKKGDISKVQTVLSSAKSHTKTNYKFVKKSSARFKPSLVNEIQKRNVYQKNDSKISAISLKETGLHNGTTFANRIDKPHQNGNVECNGYKNLQKTDELSKEPSLLSHFITEPQNDQKMNENTNNKNNNNNSINNNNNNNNNSSSSSNSNNSNNIVTGDTNEQPNLRFGLRQLALTMTQSIPGNGCKKSFITSQIINMPNVPES